MKRQQTLCNSITGWRAIKELSKADPQGSLKLLVQERNKFDSEYQKEILKIASRSANTPDAIKRWQKELKKATGGSQADIFTMLVSSNPNDPSIETLLTQSISSENPQVRMAAANEMARRRNVEVFAGSVGLPGQID